MRLAFPVSNRPLFRSDGFSTISASSGGDPPLP
jgi:hypothetical protein